MRRMILVVLLLCAPLAWQACGGGQTNTADAPAPNANAAAQATPANIAESQPQIVTATVEEARLAAGGAGEAIVRLHISEGFHVNANPASDKFYVATQVEAAPQQGVTPGKPSYPPALTKQFSFAKKPLAVYEGEAVIKLPLRADASTAKGRHTFRARITAQPCNDRECLQPRTIEAFIPVVVN